MEQIQADMADLNTRMDTRVNQLLEVIQDMVVQQAELRAIVLRNATETNERAQATVNAPINNGPGNGLVDNQVENGVVNQNNGLNGGPTGGPTRGLTNHMMNQAAHVENGNGLVPPPVMNHQAEQVVIQPQVRRGGPIPIPQLEEDYMEDWYSNADEQTESDRKLRTLEERMRAFENQGVVGFDITDLGLESTHTLLE